MTARRTYWHLQSRGRVPSEYEIASTGLLYYPGRGFGVRTPGAHWMEQHAGLSRLRCADWDRFADPRATTYASYTALQQRQTVYLDAVLDTVGDRDQSLPAEWLECVRELLAPLRYPAHGLQMVSAYAGSMAPSGRLVVALAFQTADALRVVQCVAYRLAQLRRWHVGIADEAAARWQSAPIWQPWRRLIEQLLVTYDWDEALLALNLVVKPAFDELFLGAMSRAAARHGDDTTQRLLGSLGEDSAWQRQWTRALLELLLAEDPANRSVASELVARWVPRALEAASASSERLASVAGVPAAAIFDGVTALFDDDRPRMPDCVATSPAPGVG
jgi:toluene monooxygenase system protein E